MTPLDLHTILGGLFATPVAVVGIAWVGAAIFAISRCL